MAARIAAVSAEGAEAGTNSVAVATDGRVKGLQPNGLVMLQLLPRSEQSNDRE